MKTIYVRLRPILDYYNVLREYVCGQLKLRLERVVVKKMYFCILCVVDYSFIGIY